MNEERDRSRWLVQTLGSGRVLLALRDRDGREVRYEMNARDASGAGLALMQAAGWREAIRSARRRRQRARNFAALVHDVDAAEDDS